MTRNQVLSNISNLKALQSVRKSKYERNLRLYEATMNISLDSIKSANSVGFYKAGSSYDTSVDINLNVIQSCIDTLTSKIASTKVRPYFNTVKGGYKDVQAAKTAQSYFDIVFEEQNANSEVSDAFRFSCIFDTGIIYVDPFKHKIQNVLPWQVFYKPAEETYGEITSIYYERKEYPTSLLDGYTGKEDYIHYGVYYDIKEHVYAEIYSDGKVTIHPYNKDVLPFVFLHYRNPIIGSTSTSVVDMLTPIQIQIDVLMNKVKDASQLNPAQTIFIPKTSNIEARKFSNGIGNVVMYEPSPNMTSSPVTVATPSFIDPQYMKMIEDLKQTAYEMVGISQLSATSQKPQGLNSGIALETIENIESDRFETQLNSVIRLYTDITKVCIRVYDPTEAVLPEDMFTVPVKWLDIVDSYHKMKLQFSGADKMSKDPSTKLQQLQVMAQSGIIPTATIAKYMELPDLEDGYSVANNQWNAVHTVISRCLYEDVYDVPAFVAYPLLMSEILNTQLSLFSADPVENEQDIHKLTTLFNIITGKTEEMQEYMNAEAASYSDDEVMEEQ